MKSRFLALVVGLMCCFSVSVYASDSAILDSLKPALAEAGKAGATVIIVAPPKNEPVVETRRNEFQANLLLAREETRRLIDKMPALPGNVMETLRSASPDRSMNWLVIAVATAIGGLLIGFWAKGYVQAGARDYFEYLYTDAPKSRAEKFPYLAFRAAVLALITVVLFIVAVGVALIFDSGHGPSRNTILAIISGYCVFRLLRWTLHFNFIVPELSAYRMLNLSDEDAKHMFRHWSIIDGLAVTMFAVCLWMGSLGLDPDAHKLGLILSVIVLVIFLTIVCVLEKKAFTGVVMGAGDAADKHWWIRFLGRAWLPLTVFYLMIACAVSIYRIILDKPAAVDVVLAPVAVFIISVTLHAALVVTLDKIMAHRLEKQKADYEVAVARIQKENEALTRQVLEHATEENEYAPPAIPAELPRQPEQSPFKPLLERAATLFIVVFSMIAIANAWGVDFSNKTLPFTRLIEILIVLFAGYLAYNAVKVWTDAEISREGGNEDAHGAPGGDPGGVGVSRLATLLPIFQNFLLITIVVITGMIFLSEIGLDIAPLFAGAGVVGLAIGFGAQTLIRDIFSGAFFLMDDAFRRGEYINLGSVKGTVERISIRSLQLRHHNGPLNTVPFGEITQLTNYSRDWAIMKLSLRLTYDTDAEKVRKMIKKLGVKLLEHEEIGPLFLEPLKSQGVMAMEDSAMIMRVKYTTRPGDQFTIRRFVLNEIRKMFAENGIKFANKEVTVHWAGNERQLKEEEQKAIAGAVATSIEADQPEGTKPKDAL